MTEHSKDRSAAAAIRSFFCRMRDWELKYSALDEQLEDDGVAWEAMKNEAIIGRRKILESCCEPDFLQSQVLDYLSLQVPCRYDPDRDAVREMESAEALSVFEYQQTVGLKSRSRFTVRSIEGRWMIAKAELARGTAGDVWETLLI